VTTTAPLGGRIGAGPDAAVLELLAPWRDAGVLVDADVHVAATLCRLTGVVVAAAPDVVLAAALAVRAPRLGHTCLDLTTVASSAPAEVEADRGMRAGHDSPGAVVDALPWPDVERWVERVAACALVTARPAPLVLHGARLYLDRYHRYEEQVAREIARRAAEPPAPSNVPDARRRELLDALVPPADGGDGDASAQWQAASAGATRPLTVIVGGPGTGKTHTVAALLALLVDAGGTRPPTIALAAPTGKAAARMTEAFRSRADELRASGVDGAARLADELSARSATTLHRLLGARPGSSRFRHDHRNPLAADVIVVDETSMVSLPLMAKLLDAVRPDARLVLVGDPGQLASVEAGSVLGDIAGPATDAVLGGRSVPAGPLAACVSVLTRSFRFPAGSAIDRLASAIRAGDGPAALELLAATSPTVPPPADPEATVPGPTAADTGMAGQLSLDLTPAPSAPPSAPPTDRGVRVHWVPSSADTAEALDAVLASALPPAREARHLAEAGNADAALDALGAVRILCAHRRGPFGVAAWNHLTEAALGAEAPLLPGFYLGRPVLVTANDRANGLFNGDMGVVVAAEQGPRVAFPDVEGPRLVAPVRLESVDTVHAMTIHKSQGSEFDHVVVVLPPPESRLASRELLYTAVTRARHAVTLVGTAEAVTRAVEQRVRRASGLADRLWPAT
jgi:exodeoxyribonuclease V alpha subunit